MKTIKLFATVSDVVGARRLAVSFEDGDTVRDLIHSIHEISPALSAKLLDDNGELSSVIHIYVRGRNVEWIGGLDAVIHDRDDVFIVPPMAGG